MKKTEYIVLENHPQDSRIKIKEDDIFQTLGCRGGAEYEPHTLLVLEIRTDEDGILHRERTSESALPSDNSGRVELLGRSTENSDRGGQDDRISCQKIDTA